MGWRGVSPRKALQMVYEVQLKPPAMKTQKLIARACPVVYPVEAVCRKMGVSDAIFMYDAISKGSVPYIRQQVI